MPQTAACLYVFALPTDASQVKVRLPYNTTPECHELASCCKPGEPTTLTVIKTEQSPTGRKTPIHHAILVDLQLIDSPEGDAYGFSFSAQRLAGFDLIMSKIV